MLRSGARRSVALASLVAIAAIVALASCSGWSDGSGGAVGLQDIDDVTGAEHVAGERQVDIAEDQSEMGIRIADTGDVEAGSTEAGEAGVYEPPDPPDAGPVLLGEPL